MTLLDLLLTSLIISVFCCGLFLITEPGMLFSFMREPFKKIELRKNALMKLYGGDLPLEKDYTGKAETEINRIDIILHIFKPLILCCTCMASFWGIVLFIVLHGFTTSHIPQIIICCIMSAFLNAYFINKYYHS